MNNLEFDTPFGDERKHVRLSKPSGGEDAYHIYIDGFYRGRLFDRNGIWVHLEGRLTDSEVQILGALVDKEG